MREWRVLIMWRGLVWLCVVGIVVFFGRDSIVIAGVWVILRSNGMSRFIGIIVIM